jgi:F420H(2)-dependent quinone reductase
MRSVRARMVFARGSTVSAKTFGIIPVSCFYKRGRATGLGKAFSSFWSWWASLGLPPRRQVGLEVKGRRTGRPHTLALVIAGHEGEQYLVSMLGECEWVKNVRAQGGHQRSCNSLDLI